MITASAISSIESMFEHSVRENSRVGAEDGCVITRLPGLAPADKPGNRKLVVLNISSFIFRMVVVAEFDSDASTVAHLAKILRIPDANLEGRALLDGYAEFVNMICGTVNRKLCAEFRHAGMSTPFFLDEACATYLAMINPAATRSLEVVINDSAHFRLTICTCVARDIELDFDIARFEQEGDPTGELELF
jgi:hypothetical protein